jgi:hypothetical protein
LKDDLAALGMRVGESLLDLRNALNDVADRASSDAAKRGAA